MRLLRDRKGDEDGAAALEFGLVFPVVMLAIFGIIQYGYHFWSLHTASATAREAARMLIVGTDWGCAQAHARDFADGPAVGSTPPEVTREYHAEDGTPQTAPVVGSMVTVTVAFQSLDIGMPFLPLPDDGQVSQSATARIENVPPQRLKCDWTQDYVVGAGTY
jgi:Flp pilus assembly protein TadG